MHARPVPAYEGVHRRITRGLEAWLVGVLSIVFALALVAIRTA